MVREGQERVEICITFQLESQNLAYHWLSEQELQDPDNPTDRILRRIINADDVLRLLLIVHQHPLHQKKRQYLVHINGQIRFSIIVKK